MKTLEQLDIYHGKWEATDNGCVCHTETDEDGDENSFELCDVWGPKDVQTANFISAAPDLYDALYNVAKYLGLDADREVGALGRKIKAALAKAAGEDAKSKEVSPDYDREAEIRDILYGDAEYCHCCANRSCKFRGDERFVICKGYKEV